MVVISTFVIRASAAGAVISAPTIASTLTIATYPITRRGHIARECCAAMPFLLSADGVPPPRCSTTSVAWKVPALGTQARRRPRRLSGTWGRLLDRTMRSVALRQVGRDLWPVVARALGESDAVGVNARALAGKRPGLVTIAALPSIASTLPPVTVAGFKAPTPGHPGQAARRRGRSGSSISSKSGGVDSGIGSPTGRDPALRISHLMNDPVCVAPPPGPFLERRERIRREDLLANH